MIKQISIATLLSLASTISAHDVVDCVANDKVIKSTDVENGVCYFELPKEYQAKYSFTSDDDYDVKFYYATVGGRIFFSDIKKSGTTIPVPAKYLAHTDDELVVYSVERNAQSDDNRRTTDYDSDDDVEDYFTDNDDDQDTDDDDDDDDNDSDNDDDDDDDHDDHDDHTKRDLGDVLDRLKEQKGEEINSGYFRVQSASGSSTAASAATTTGSSSGSSSTSSTSGSSSRSSGESSTITSAGSSTRSSTRSSDSTTLSSTATSQSTSSSSDSSSSASEENAGHKLEGSLMAAAFIGLSALL